MKKIQQITTWLRSKFLLGYSEPTPTEIKNFLQRKYTPATVVAANNVTYLQPFELREIIDNHFAYKCDKKIVHNVFKELNYQLLNKKVGTFSNRTYKVIPLIEK